MLSWLSGSVDGIVLFDEVLYEIKYDINNIGLMWDKC